MPASPPSGAMSADVFISYDFANDIFHAKAELYVKLWRIKRCRTFWSCRMDGFLRSSG